MRTLSVIILIAGLVPPPASRAAETGAGYGSELAQVYGTYQAVLARKEACDEAVPGMRRANEKSYSAWRGRNAKTIAELDDRLDRMIRGASKDDKEYARNVGKYEGVVLQQRQEVKQALLGHPREELEALCKSLPQLLGSAENDLENLYADELKRIRGRR